MTDIVVRFSGRRGADFLASVAVNPASENDRAALISALSDTGATVGRRYRAALMRLIPPSLRNASRRLSVRTRVHGSAITVSVAGVPGRSAEAWRLQAEAVAIRAGAAAFPAAFNRARSALNNGEKT